MSSSNVTAKQVIEFLQRYHPDSMVFSYVYPGYDTGIGVITPDRVAYSITTESPATPAIDTGDVVLHVPTGERWVVAYAKGDRLAWCGWPEGEAKVSDCHLIEAATDEKRMRLLRDMAAMPTEDARKRYARAKLGNQIAHA